MDPIYVDINPNEEVVQVESMCMYCHKQGITKIMLTLIPFFKELVISSFECNFCGYSNNEIKQAGPIQDQGIILTLTLKEKKDIQRDIVRSEYAVIKIPELQFEIPSSNKGSITTIEGLIQNSIDELSLYQKERIEQNPVQGEQIEQFLIKLQDIKNGNQLPFTFQIEDPSGNSFIKNPDAPKIDQNLQETKFYRTREQCESMGLSFENQEEQIKQQNLIIEENKKKYDEKIEQEQQLLKEQKINKIPEYKSKDLEIQKLKTLPQAHRDRLDFNKPLEEYDDLKGESFSFPTSCHSCFKEGHSKMCIVSVPFFKELIIMAFNCQFCGVATNEIKTGGEMSQKGKKMTLQVSNPDDLRRDVFKSESARLFIPEIDLELDYGTLGGVYSTIEGLVQSILENFKKTNPFMGDSDSVFKKKIDEFYNRLEKFQNLEENFTLIIDDPLDNSFIQNYYYPEEDKRMVTEIYDRTYEQNEEFGLNDIKTENY